MEVFGANNPSRPHSPVMSKTAADVRNHAATLLTLPASIAADIVERLSTEDVCTLAQVCVYITSHPSPRALACADTLRCRCTHL